MEEEGGVKNWEKVLVGRYTCREGGSVVDGCKQF